MKSLKILAFALLGLALATVAFSVGAPAASASTSATGKLAYFYKPPSDGSSTSVVATGSSYMILSHGDESYRDSLKAAGFSAPVYQYLLAFEVDGPGPYTNSSAHCDSSYQPRHSTVAMDVGDFCSILHPNESYFLHNSRGERVYLIDGSRTEYYLNPASAGWKSFFVQRALRELQGDSTHAARGFDGLFLDDVWVTMDWMQNHVSNQTGSVQEFSSTGAYTSATVGFLSQLRASLKTSQRAFPLYGNMASDGNTSDSWNSYLAYMDGGMDEAFAADWHTGYLSTTDWNTDLKRVETVLAQGKTHVAVTQGSQGDSNRQKFGYGSYLLVMQPGKSYFRYADASNGYEYDWQYSNYSLDIGSPSGARFQQADGSWRRNFTRGYVIVNPTTHTTQIVQSNKSRGGQPGGGPLTTTTTSIANKLLGSLGHIN